MFIFQKNSQFETHLFWFCSGSSWEPSSSLHQKIRQYFPPLKVLVHCHWAISQLLFWQVFWLPVSHQQFLFPVTFLQPLQSHFFECGHAKMVHSVQLAVANYLTCREVNSSCLSYSIITSLFIKGKPTLHHTRVYFHLNHHSGPEILARVAGCQDIIFFLHVSPALLVPLLSIISKHLFWLNLPVDPSHSKRLQSEIIKNPVSLWNL